MAKNHPTRGGGQSLTKRQREIHADNVRKHEQHQRRAPPHGPAEHPE